MCSRIPLERSVDHLGQDLREFTAPADKKALNSSVYKAFLPMTRVPHPSAQFCSYYLWSEGFTVLLKPPYQSEATQGLYSYHWQYDLAWTELSVSVSTLSTSNILIKRVYKRVPW